MTSSWVGNEVSQLYTAQLPLHCNNAVKVATIFCSRPGIILCTIRIPSSDQIEKGGGRHVSENNIM